MPFDATPENNRILIIGGGMAGSLLALVLGRAGQEVVVFDPRRDPQPIFRNEKLGTEQVALLQDLGALSCFEQACWPEGAYPAGRPGLTDCGAHHHLWLASVRAAWPETVRFVEAMVERVDTGSNIQTITTSQGEIFSGRLVVLASGRMTGLRDALGIRSRTVSAGHSVCLGFSVDRALPSQVIDLPHGSGVGYVSIFPMPGETRVNVFSYRALTDPWTRRMSQDPIAALAELSPTAGAALSEANVIRRCEARGTDLYEVSGHIQPGLVLIGDAFHAPCPASGTGMLRILHDIKRLTQAHLPAWLETHGMGVDKIARFYTDPVKARLDETSLNRSIRGRGAAVGKGLHWDAWRALRKLKQVVTA